MATGVPGFAAWVGIEVLGDPKPGSNVFVSAASGAVGMYAGQLAKLRGCRVIGSTGSDDKLKLMKEEFGYDDGFNYHKETDYDAALSRYIPQYLTNYYSSKTIYSGEGMFPFYIFKSYIINLLIT